VPDVALDLRFLRYAVIAAEQGSFRKAATLLGLSQASVSRRIDILESRLGFKLFCRTPGGVSLTLVGERFLAEAIKGIDHLDRAIHMAASTSRGERGIVRVGILSSLNSGFLRDVLTTFRQKYRHVEVIVQEATARESLHYLVIGEIDVSFTTGIPNIPGYATELLWSERVLVAMPAGHDLARREGLTWQELQHEAFIVSSGGPGPEIHDYLVRRLARLGFRPDVKIQFVGREGLMNLVAIGYGLTLVSNSSLGREMPGVVIRPILGDGDVLESSAMWSSKNSNPVLRRLLSIARSLARSRPAVGAGSVIYLLFASLIAPCGGPEQILDLFL
jgi:DNA-binding transcriptional LysR family regulator